MFSRLANHSSKLYNSKESSASTHICKFSSRYNLAYSSGSSIASDVKAQSDPGVVFKFFGFPTINTEYIACTGININAVLIRIVFCKYCSHRIESPYHSIISKKIRSISISSLCQFYFVLYNFLSLIFSLIRVHKLVWEDIT